MSGRRFKWVFLYFFEIYRRFKSCRTEEPWDNPQGENGKWERGRKGCHPSEVVLEFSES